ncbi:hypothetical protein BaRGS_00035196 [Batillaria attramentaria]|uniref:EF-hand domain-containing protein n=1 Tax=Batillaria attramentaria TaxID=370345 RepID=A0ABD0JF85_9CAEN
MSTREVTIRMRFLYITQEKTRLDPAALLLQLDAILPETQVLLHTPVTPYTQGKRDGKPDSAKPDNDVLIGALSQACPDIDLAPDAQVSQLVEDAFQNVNANKDGQLNANEVAEFATMITMVVVNAVIEDISHGRLQCPHVTVSVNAHDMCSFHCDMYLGALPFKRMHMISVD